MPDDLPPDSAFPTLRASPALIAGHGRLSLLTDSGELIIPDRARLQPMLRAMPPPLLVHAPATLRGIGLRAPPPPGPWLDLMELFLFVWPGRHAAPTPRGLAIALDIPSPQRIEADFLPVLADALLDTLRGRADTPNAHTDRATLGVLSAGGWPWSGIVADALDANLKTPALYDSLRVWRDLPKWEDTAPRPPPGNQPVLAAAARHRLRQILGPAAEARPGQEDFASAATHAFAPREDVLAPRIVLAEAGTGTGKTLGYVAPASLWAEANHGSVWISTYTRHLQAQIESELHRLHPDANSRRQAIVVRKGRENYLCLLNYEDAVSTILARGQSGRAALIPLALLSLWMRRTQDGELGGGDLPGWFGELYGRATLQALADRRGECIHGACPHYQTCFVEHSIRRARNADLVIANHALVMSQAAWNAASSVVPMTEDATPTRYVFDEGHHLPEAADSAFSTTLSGLETAELRRWLLGAEGSRSRARGIRRRLEDLVARDTSLQAPLDNVLQAARALPAPGWTQRFSGQELPAPIPDPEPSLLPLFILPERGLLPEPQADNPTETFLAALDRQLAARNVGRTARMDRECDLHPIPDDLQACAETLTRALERLSAPLHRLIECLRERLVTEASELEPDERARIEALARSIARRAIAPVDAWIAMLTPIANGTPRPSTPIHVDIIRASPLPKTRNGPAEPSHDIGLHRHWLDPMTPFAATMQGPAHGMLLTSATLRDQPDSTEDRSEQTAWQAAEERLGMGHFAHKPLRATVISPFDYRQQTRAFVVTDLDRDNLEQLASAYRELFLASGGGALGLFTAISRLRKVHEFIREPMDAACLPLYAQHVDAMDNATLVDVFRAETDSCLLGTDAMRDGVDVPGQALRLVVFERTPWPRPDILHRERRRYLARGENAYLAQEAQRHYDDRLTRMRLRQAFGRLVRRSSDRGVFVMLDRQMPSRLNSAFPEGVQVERMGLAETIRAVAEFVGPEKIEHDDTISNK